MLTSGEVHVAVLVPHDWFSFLWRSLRILTMKAGPEAVTSNTAPTLEEGTIKEMTPGLFADTTNVPEKTFNVRNTGDGLAWATGTEGIVVRSVSGGPVWPDSGGEGYVMPG